MRVFCNLNRFGTVLLISVEEGEKAVVNVVLSIFTLRRNLIIICTKKKVPIQKKNSPKTMEVVDYRQKYTGT